MQLPHVPSIPPLQRDFIDRAVPLLFADPRIVGVAATGSYAVGAMDSFSDIDLVTALRGLEMGWTATAAVHREACWWANASRRNAVACRCRPTCSTSKR